MFLSQCWRQLVDRHSKAFTGHGRRRSGRGPLRLEPLEDRTLLSGPGSLDPTFGSGGLVSVSLSSSLPTEFLNALVLQPDGKLVAAGGANSGGQGGEFALARFNTDGSLDSAFGTGGSVLTSFPSPPPPFANGTSALGVALQADGKIVAAGFYAAGGGVSHFALARYNPDGSLDSSFGTGGIVTTSVGMSDFATSVVIQSDGKIVAAGSAAPPFSSSSDFALVRYNPDGALDSTFGTNGVVETNLGPSDAGAHGLALQADGKLAAVGTTSTSGGNFHLALVRYNLDGSLDATFGAGGEVLDNFPNGATGGSVDSANAVSIQPNGAIVIVGSFVDSSQRGDAGLARYHPDGSPDTTFNGTGKQTLIVPGGVNDALDAVALQGNGQLVAAGSNGVPGGSYLIVTRYNADGTLDTGFGTAGVTSTKFTVGGNDGASSVVIQTDGKIVAAGTANSGGSDSNFALARYLGSASDAPLTATGTTVSATAGAPFTGMVASFTDADPAGNVRQYTATITWGDGHSSAATITANGQGGFNVTGTNTYAAAGTDTIMVQINDIGGATAMATSTATVAALGQTVQHGQAAGIGFWHNKNGQALIDSFNGGSTATALADWLAATFPNLYGASGGGHNLTGQSNAQVAAFYQVLFRTKGPKLDAEVLATALNVYATTLSLGGTAATPYGFTVTADGLGADSFNVRSNGAAFGVPNNTTLNVYQILLAANQQAVNGVLYNGDQNLRKEANNVFDAINSLGGL